MELCENELKMLINIYERDINHHMEFKPLYELKGQSSEEKIQEKAMYLLKLKRVGYIDFLEDENANDSKAVAFIKGGWTSPKYGNNVLFIRDSEIHITKDGIKAAEELEKSMIDKAKENGIKIAKSLGELAYKEFRRLLFQVLSDL